MDESLERDKDFARRLIARDNDAWTDLHKEFNGYYRSMAKNYARAKNSEDCEDLQQSYSEEILKGSSVTNWLVDPQKPLRNLLLVILKNHAMRIGRRNERRANLEVANLESDIEPLTPQRKRAWHLYTESLLQKLDLNRGILPIEHFVNLSPTSRSLALDISNDVEKSESCSKWGIKPETYEQQKSRLRKQLGAALKEGGAK
jgi:DNA-directed RNA polymerase specialized sigma24 family protein